MRCSVEETEAFLKTIRELLSKMASTGQASHMLDVTPERVRQLMRSGRLAYVNTPIGALIPLSGVEQLAKELSGSAQAQAYRRYRRQATK